MAGEDLINYAGSAAVAYADALNQARNTQNMLLRQYGFVAPSGSGYSTEGAQAAFDPNTLFDVNTGGVDQAKLKQAMSSIQVGGTGLLADVARAGASGEADVVAETRSRLGEFGGGLLQQRRGLAESVASGKMGQAKGEFISALSQGLAPIGGAWQDLQAANAQAALSNAASEAAKASVVNANAPMSDSGSAAAKPPANAKNYQRWTNPVNGQKMQFINGKWRKAGG